MPINPNIPLSAVPIDVTQPIQIRRQKEQDAQRSQLVDQRSKINQQNLEAGGLELDQLRSQIATAEGREAMQQYALTTLSLRDMLARDDVEGAKEVTRGIQAQLEQSGKDIPELGRFMQALDKNPEGAGAILDSEINRLRPFLPEIFTDVKDDRGNVVGQRNLQTGRLEEVPQPEGFTLSPGQQRFQGGSPIAENTNERTPGSVVNVGTGESKATETFGASVGDRASNRVSQAQDAQRQNNQLDVIDLAISRGIETGMGAETILNLKSLGQTLFDLEFDDSVGGQEVVRQITNEMALRLRNPESGLGLTGNTSNKDLDFLKSSIPGLQRTPQGNKWIIEMMRRQNQLKTAVAQKQSEIIRENNGVVPNDLDSRLMDFVDSVEFLTDEERKEIEGISDGQFGQGQQVGRFQIEVVQ